jgi:hypothetical protein
LCFGFYGKIIFLFEILWGLRISFFARRHIRTSPFPAFQYKIKPKEIKLFIVKIMRENVKAIGKENNKKRHKEARMFLYAPQIHSVLLNV